MQEAQRSRGKGFHRPRGGDAELLPRSSSPRAGDDWEVTSLRFS